MADRGSGIGDSESAPRTIVVWDLPTRVFKWLLVCSVMLAFIISSSHPNGSVFLVHIICGYVVTLLLLFRFAWGLVGGEHARFRSFVRGWGTVRAYGLGLLRFNPPRVVGHNPVGGWMIVTMLTVLSTIVLSGLLAEGKTGGAGPLSALLPVGTVAVLGDIHAWLGFLIIWLVGLHVAGVLFESLLHRENLILTMITGRKQTIDPRYMYAQRSPLWLTASLVIMLVVLGTWMASVTRMPPAPSTATLHKPSL